MNLCLYVYVHNDYLRYKKNIPFYFTRFFFSFFFAIMRE